MSVYVIDAGVAVIGFIPEPDSNQARRRLAPDNQAMVTVSCESAGLDPTTEKQYNHSGGCYGYH